jgi:hypothetical protein
MEMTVNGYLVNGMIALIGSCSVQVNYGKILGLQQGDQFHD